MRFDWYEYLIVAWELLGRRGRRATREARQRVAISRAYYAAFITARNYLQEVQNEHIGRRDVHQYVIDHFESSPNLEWATIGDLLRRMRYARTRADYDNAYLDLRRDAHNVPRYAEEVIRLIAGL